MEFIQTIKIPVALAILLFASVGVACANLDGWQYHKNIIVNENSGSTLTDYQILVNLSGADFPTEAAKSDGSDLRFTNASGNQLNYWIESYDATNKKAKIWVKVPRIPANGVTTLQMHYGNADASAMSNGTATFEFFDDFEGYAVGSSPSTWTQSGNTAGRINDAVSVSGNQSFKLFGVLGSCWGNPAHRHFDMQSPYYIDFDVYNGNEALSGCHPYRGGFILNTGPSWTTNNRFFIEFRGDGTISPSLGAYSVQQWYHVKMKYAVNETNATISYWINNEYKGTFSYPKRSYESDLKWYTIGSNEGSAWFDNTRLRKYADPEPTVTIGTPLPQQSRAWTRWGYDLAQNHYYPYPSTTQVSISDFSEYWSIQNSAGVLTKDINGDGFLEIVLTDGSALRAYNNTGTELWNTTTTSWINLIADVTGDNVPEIITSQRSVNTLQMHIYNNTGTLLKTLSKSGGYDSDVSAVYASDLDNDGSIEILAIQNAAYSRDPRGLSMFDYDTAAEEWHYEVGPRIGGSAYGDVNEDGIIDAVLGGHSVHNGGSGCGVKGTATCTTDDDIYTIVFNAVTGSEIFTKDYFADGQSNGNVFHAIVDLDHDSDYNILAFEGHDPTYYRGTSQVHLINDTGAVLKTWNGPENVYVGRYAIADLNSDGYDEIVFYNHFVDIIRIIDHDLTEVTSTGVGKVRNIVINDINGDGVNEILVADETADKIIVFDGDLNELGNFSIANPTAIVLSDINNDGINELIAQGDTVKVFSVPSGTIPETVVSISDVQVSKDGTASPLIELEGMKNFGTATLELSYYPSVVTVQRVESGDVGTSSANIDNKVGKTNITVYVSSATGPDSPLTLAKVNLKAVGNNGDTSPLNLNVITLADANGTRVTARVENGVFTITSILRGDANDDGIVDAIDAMFVAQYTVGNRDASTLNMANADANLDGTVDAIDAMFIAQYTVGARSW